MLASRTLALKMGTYLPALTLAVTLAFSPSAAAVDVPAPPAGGKCLLDTLTRTAKELDPQARAKVLAALASDPALKGEVLALLKDARSGKLSLRKKKTRALVATLGAKLQDSGTLPQLLRAIADEAEKAGKLPAGITPEAKQALVQQLASTIDAELSARGLTAASRGAQYEDWLRLSTRLLTETQRELEPLAAAGKVGFDHPEFLQAFERQTGATFSRGNAIKPLINGPASFEERARLIRDARKRIHVLSWAFYDDVTGMKFARELVEARKRGVDVRVMVDGQVALKPHHDQALKLMEESGVQVIRWRSLDPLRRFDGQHRKLMIVDDLEAVGGGMNFGDVYSHLGPEGTAKWRDTDVLVKGQAALDANQLFKRLWNEQVDGSSLTLAKLDLAAPAVEAPAGTAAISVIDHRPGADENILRATILAIEGARKSVDIENAYLILDPAVFKAALKAKKRGVRVRALTNSDTSIDEPIITRPILRTVNHLVKNGIEVYLKTGKDTLHSKFLTVDGQYSWVGSQNLHPRSQRYEGEAIFSVVDKDFTAALTNAFEADIRQATRVTDRIPLERTITDDIGELFHDQF